MFVHYVLDIFFSVLLTGIADKEAAARVVNEGGFLDESDIVVRPEELPSALLDHRVPLQKLKKYFTAEAWLLLSSSSKNHSLSNCLFLFFACYV